MRSIDCFKMNASVVGALPEIFRRGSGLAPKIDAWTFVALWATAHQRRSTLKVSSKMGDVVSATFSVSRSELLSTLGYEKTRIRSDGTRDYEGNHWRELDASLKRLAARRVGFHYTEQPLRGPTRNLRHRGPLVRLKGQLVTLHCYPGFKNSFFVLVPATVFTLRTHVGETETAVLWWLLREHRGYVPKGARRLQHRWEIIVTPDGVSEGNILMVRSGRSMAAYRRVCAALDVLTELGVLTDVHHTEHGVRVHLSGEFFHTGGDDEGREPASP